MKFTTVAYKGSKRKLLSKIERLCQDSSYKTFFDGFSGTGIVSAYMRSRGYAVTANDLNYSSYVYGSVFLQGYNENVVQEKLKEINNLRPAAGWLTENYSGEKERIIRGTGGKKEFRPLGYTLDNAMRIDAAREHIESCRDLSAEDKNALVFSIILGADKVFNNSNDQKSSFKKWTPASQKQVCFKQPTVVTGPSGCQTQGDILGCKIDADVIYLDPPYTHGVLYSSCYHLNNSIAKWDKPELDHDYALPRPVDVCYRKNKQNAGGFYNKQTARDAFNYLIGESKYRRLIMSYSDAPRNTLSIEELISICQSYGSVSLESYDHKICTQANNLNKISDKLKEFFIIVDR